MFRFKIQVKSAVYVMLLAIPHKNTEIQHLLNVEMPICGPSLDENDFPFWFVCC